MNQLTTSWINLWYHESTYDIINQRMTSWDNVQHHESTHDNMKTYNIMREHTTSWVNVWHHEWTYHIIRQRTTTWLNGRDHKLTYNVVNKTDDHWLIDWTHWFTIMNQWIHDFPSLIANIKIQRKNIMTLCTTTAKATLGSKQGEWNQQ